MTAPPFDRVATVRVGDIDVAHVDVGPRDGTPVVLVHGLACGMRVWARMIPRLARCHRVVACDLRGHGRTTAPESAASYSAAHLARDLTGLLDALALPRVHLVGHSMGGGPALAASLAQPGRVASLVLANVGSGAENAWGLVKLAAVWSNHAKGGWDVLAPDMMRGEFLKFLARRSPGSRRYMDALLRQHPLHGIVHTLEQVLARRKPLFRLTTTLQRVQVPTLVLTGDRDYVCHKAERVLLDNIPGAVGTRIAGASHMGPVERPAGYAEAILGFIDRAS